MTHHNSTDNQSSKSPAPPTSSQSEPPIWRCFFGSGVAAAIARACMLLTASIAETFASKPIHSTNPTAVNISIAVRTLVTGITTLGTFVFAFAAFGLFCLGIQLIFQRLTNKPKSELQERVDEG